MLACLSLACLAIVWRGQVWLTALQPGTYYQRHFLPDFFQEWASARNYFAGLPIYTSQEVTLPLYLGEQKAADDTLFIKVNAHPPSSVLLALPFGKLDYAEAFLLWNEITLILFGASIWLVLRALEMDTSVRTGLVIFAFLLFCHPLWSQIQQGQLTIVVAFLVTLCWFLDRSDRPWLAGIALGVATALKLFPGFLFLPLILRGRWKAVFAGTASLVGVSALTLAVLGLGTYRDYVCDVLPIMRTYLGMCHNLSPCGVWHKLLVPAAHWMPVDFTSGSPYPFAGSCGYVVTSGIIVSLVSLIVLRAKDDIDLSFSASIVAMLLVSPITWDHYLLLLVLPIALLWRRLPRSGIAWPMFLFVVFLSCIEPFVVMQHCLILAGAARSPETGHWLAGPLETLTALSVPCYAIVGLFVLMFCAGRQGTTVPSSSAELSVCLSPSKGA